MRTLEGKFNGKGLRIGIVAGRFNEFITSKLVGGAVDVLKRNDVNDEDIDIAWVPGAFEIPLITKKMAESKKYDAILTLLIFKIIQYFLLNQSFLMRQMQHRHLYFQLLFQLFQLLLQYYL